VPRDLETICLKCLQKEPHKRYAGADELADDLRRFLDGRPILARPVGAVERLWRWCGRNPLVASLLGLVCAGVVALAVAAVLLFVANQNEREARELADHERGRAERNFTLARKAAESERAARKLADHERGRAEQNYGLARKALDHAVTQVANHSQLSSPAFRELRKQILEAVAPIYEEVVAQRSEDPNMLAEQGRAYGQRAVLRGQQGEIDQAVADYQQALKIFTRLAEQWPGEPEHHQQLLKTHDNLGILLARAQRYGEAEAAHRRGLETAKKLAVAFPKTPEYRFEAGRAHQNLSAIHHQQGQLVQAEAEERQGLAELGPLVEQYPGNAEYRQHLGRGHNNLGYTLRRLKRLDDAEAHYLKAVVIREKLIADFPTVPRYRQELSLVCNSLGTLLQERKRPKEALSYFYREVAEMEKAVAAFPKLLEYRVDLAWSYRTLGNVLSDLGKPAEALPWYDKSLLALQTVLTADPRLADLRKHLITGSTKRAALLVKLQRPVDAVVDWDRVLLLEVGPARDGYRLQRALALVGAGDHVRAVAEADALARAKGVKADVLYEAARLHALAIPAAGQDLKQPREERERLAEQYAARALALLEQARAAGWFRDAARRERLKTDSAFEPLHGRAEWAALMKGLVR
jgi:tetratricopeptide (TPR) repeat protein